MLKLLVIQNRCFASTRNSDIYQFTAKRYFGYIINSLIYDIKCFNTYKGTRESNKACFTAYYLIKQNIERKKAM